MWGQRTEDRGQRTEDRGQRTEDGCVHLPGNCEGRFCWSQGLWGLYRWPCYGEPRLGQHRRAPELLTMLVNLSCVCREGWPAGWGAAGCDLQPAGGSERFCSEDLPGVSEGRTHHEGVYYSCTGLIAVQWRAVQCRLGQCSERQASAVLHSAVQYNAVQCSVLQDSALALVPCERNKFFIKFVYDNQLEVNSPHSNDSTNTNEPI